MKLKALSMLAALLLVTGLSACSSSDDASDDTTTTEAERTDDTSDDTADDEGEDVDEAEAALEKIERNFGLNKKDDDSSDTTDSDDTLDSDLTSGLSDEEQECVVDSLAGDEDLLAIAEDIESASPEDQSLVLQVFYSCLSPESLELVLADFTAGLGVDVTPDEADCILSTMISDPATVSVLFSGAEASPEDLAFTVGVVFGCLSPESQVSFIETSLGDTGLTAEQNTCLAEALVADEELLATIVTLGIDPTYEPDATETQALVDMFVGCGVDPSTL